MADMIYLASPYSHDDPAVREQRFRDVCSAAAAIMGQGFFVFSPIAHSHPIALAGNIPGDWDYWQEYDSRMINACDELWVLTLDGWQTSRGVNAEIAIARAANKRVFFVAPETATERVSNG